MHAWLEQQIDSSKDYMALLLHPELPAQVAMILLRLSVIPQLGYLARVVPPSLLAPHALRFDDMVLDVVMRKFLLPNPLPDVAKFFLSLPIKVGGFGLRKASVVSCPAYFCAVSAAAEGILELLPVERRRALLFDEKTRAPFATEVDLCVCTYAYFIEPTKHKPSQNT